MAANRWDDLTAWHNAWLVAGPAERERLRLWLRSNDPDLASEAEALADASGTLDGFLETPALVLAAPTLAGDAPSLSTGEHVGPYRIAALLSRGGMGEVYRATDVRLDRDVALKIVARLDAAGPNGVERFLQEARATASIDHPNIVRLYDVGVDPAGRPFLVTELLEGETLRSRILRGPIASADAARIAADVARGLAAAHMAGLVHRDLKPENVFLTRASGTKILDFGVAKLTDNNRAVGGAATMTGVLLGTAGYLAPEQVTGEAVDGRSDLFALGAMLFEMLTGARAFARGHLIDTLHAIVHEPPGDAVAFPLKVPPALHRIVIRLLEKAPDARFQSAGDVAWALDQLPQRSDSLRLRGSGVRRRFAHVLRGRARTAGAILMSAALGVAGIRWATTRRSDSARFPLARFSWSVPEGAFLDSVPAVSPDGGAVAFAAADGHSSLLYLRALGDDRAVALAGTDDARHPFWSPDGQSIAFFARGRLVRMSLQSRVPVVVADAPDSRGGAWSASNVIVFCAAAIDHALVRVAATGGPVEPVTELARTAGENSHRWPVFLPDGRHLVYFVRSVDDARRGVYMRSIDDPPSTPGRLLFLSDSDAHYVAVPGGGALVSVVQHRIEARRIDPAIGALIGDPQVVATGAGAQTPYYGSMLSAAPGLLAFVRESIPFGARLASADRDGRRTDGSGDWVPINWPRMSPDGQWLAYQRIDAERGNPDIWTTRLVEGTRVRVTTGSDDDALPVWSPDGRQLAFVTGRLRNPVLEIAHADGTGVTWSSRCPGQSCFPTDWSPDGSYLVADVVGAESVDVWRVPVNGGSPSPLVHGRFDEGGGRISPDGRWLAYVSNESGRDEVSVRSLAPPARRIVVSSGGGSQPVWRRDGRELFYVDQRSQVVAVPIAVAGGRSLTAGSPTHLDLRAGPGHFGQEYDVSPDGRRFYFVQRNDGAAPRTIELMLGWESLLVSAR